MSDEYSTIYLILTSYLPQILFYVLFPGIVVGVALRFMKNPAKNI